MAQSKIFWTSSSNECVRLLKLPLLDDVPLNIRARMLYLQDGAPGQYPIAVRNHLNNNLFTHLWIGRGSKLPWPPRSPDLNSLDIYFWGEINTLVYSVANVNTRNEFWKKIVAAANDTRHIHPTFFADIRVYYPKNLFSKIWVQLLSKLT